MNNDNTNSLGHALPPQNDMNGSSIIETSEPLGIEFCRLYDSHDGHSNHCATRRVKCNCGQADLADEWNQHMKSLTGAELDALTETDSENTKTPELGEASR